MPILEPATDVPGVPLPFRTYEDDPLRATRRGFALLRYWCRARGVAPSRHVARVAMAAAAIVRHRVGGAADPAMLADYSIFVRLTASAWQLRSVQALAPVISHALTTDDEKEFSHDECVLFLAAKLRACGMGVVPSTPGGFGVSNPDLCLTAGTSRGADVYFEVKERDPGGNRSLRTLSTYVRRQVHECARQIQSRNARGFAFIDLGIISETTIAAVRRSLDAALLRHPDLYAVMVSGTLLKLQQEDNGAAFFVPVFRSDMRVLPGMHIYQGRDRLTDDARVALHRAFDPRFVPRAQQP